MVMQPKVLILDEPTSQLDPIAAADFIATLKKLNTEFGITVLLVEHRLEDVFPIADKVLLMENGCVLLYDLPRAVGKNLKKINPEHPMLKGLPSAVRLYNLLSSDEVCPLTVKEGQEFFRRNFKRNIDFPTVINQNIPIKPIRQSSLKMFGSDMKEICPTFCAA